MWSRDHDICIKVVDAIKRWKKNRNEEGEKIGNFFKPLLWEMWKTIWNH